MTEKRSKKGAALLAVLVIGMTSIVFLMALASIVTSAVRASSADKWAESIRNAAEIGADYAIDQFNMSVINCPLDAVPNSGVSTKTTILPATLFTSTAIDGVVPTAGVPNVVVTVKVSQIADDEQWKYLAKYSSIYSPELDYTKSVSASWLEPASSNLTVASGGGYRIVESTATNGLVTKTIRVILRARFDLPPGELPENNLSAPRQSFFNQPLFANTDLKLGSSDGSLVVQDSANQLATTSAQNSYLLNVTTNKSATIGTNTEIFGNVKVSSSGSTSADMVASIGSGSTIHGTLTTNGQQAASVKATEGAAPASADNVRADVEILTNPTAPLRSGENTTPAVQIEAPNTPLSQNLSAPVPQPTNAQALASLDVASGKTIQGDFNSNGLNSTGVDPITLQNDGANPPTKFFIDNTNSNSAVDIDSSVFINKGAADPRKLQIWYEGTKPVSINLAAGKDFSGLVYAPNAPVSVTGVGNFTGGIVGKVVDVDISGKLNVYSPLTDSTNSTSGKENFNYGLGYQTDGKSSAIKGWQPVVWQEI